MSRKAKFYLIVVLIIAIGVFVLYRFSRPQEAPVINHTTISNDLDYKSVNEYVYKDGNAVALFFYSSNDPDSNLVIKDMLDVIKAENAIKTYSKLYYVDLKDLPLDDAKSYMKANWSINNFPTFLLMSIKDTKVEITDVLEWDIENPYKIDNVRDWLTQHNLLQSEG